MHARPAGLESQPLTGAHGAVSFCGTRATIRRLQACAELAKLAQNKTPWERTMPARTGRFFALTALAAAAALTATAAYAEKKYDPGASDTEIKIGNIMPYSGPASYYG